MCCKVRRIQNLSPISMRTPSRGCAVEAPIEGMGLNSEHQPEHYIGLRFFFFKFSKYETSISDKESSIF